MIKEDPLKNLEVQVKNGGTLISHRAVFTPDSTSLLVVTGNKILIYNIATSRCTGTIEPPSAEDICNIAIDPSEEDTVLVCTVKGLLYYYRISTGELKLRRHLNLAPKNWTATVILSVDNIVYPNPTNFFILATVEGYPLPSLYSVSETMESPYFLERLCVDIVRNSHSLAFGVGGKFLAAIQEKGLYVRDCVRKVVKKHLYGDRKLTSVAVHPYDWVCATGDDTGRIILWVNSLEQNSPAKTVFHWHTLPVGDLSFSVDGSQIHSGGGECTLVKWDISHVENKRTIPRLGLPIRHVTVSSKSSLTAVSQADNSIKIIDSHNKVIGNIQNITQCYIPEDEKDTVASDSTYGGSRVYQAGLVEDPIRHALVMNGKPGQLQCFSFAEDKHLYDLDITNQNYITSERNKAIPFSDVNHISFSKNGRWLITSESRFEEGSFTETRLKFWKFDSVKQKFSLNTSIDWPHENGVVSLKIQPIGDEDGTLIAATSGGDRRFKTWGIVHDTSIHSKSEWWNCENVGTYRNLAAGPLRFSADGSLLAVSFFRVLTLWTTENHEFKGALSHQRLDEPLRMIEFGNKTCSHLVVCSAHSYLAVWDVIAFSLLWAVPLQVDSLAVDQFSENVAVFSSKNHAYIFRASDPEPIAVYNYVSKSKVLSSVFVSSICTKNTEMESTLLFINSSQELCSFLPKDFQKNDKSASIKYSSNSPIPVTPFAQIVADKTVSHVPKLEKGLQATSGGVGLVGAQIVQAVIESSPHTMPSISFYCEQLLNATTAKINPGERFQEMEKLVLDSHLSNKVKALKFDVDQPENMDVDDTKPSEVVDVLPDLSIIADENISWIHNIVFS
ncbi:unnamed protein product [Allacma fusca]|uniref:WD repeat-containing protein 75 second beta-propeller domain-containing protein n=1 Tax=Allacma fusca TaxID=39272 RepID=A0A8J2JZ04_9HEXA|nr:unnamed protein product [Allacma fusca]